MCCDRSVVQWPNKPETSDPGQCVGTGQLFSDQISQRHLTLDNASSQPACGKAIHSVLFNVTKTFFDVQATLKRGLSHLNKTCFVKMHKVVTLILTNGNAVWSPQLKQQWKMVKRIQRRATKLYQGWEIVLMMKAWEIENFLYWNIQGTKQIWSYF